MYLPSIFSNDYCDDLDFFEMPFKNMTINTNQNLMKTDVREDEESYTLDISVPGFKKEEITAELKDGYMTVKASTETSDEDKDAKSGRYIRRERYTGSCSRTFYVGEAVTEEDIKAKYENGVLTLNIPKKAMEKKEAEKRMISIL